MILKYPWVLLLIPLIPLVVILAGRRPVAAIRFSSAELVRALPVTLRIRLRRALPWIRGAALLALVCALARPQHPLAQERVYKEGIDIVLALDTSTSMEALDFKIGGKRYNRLHVVKQVVDEFIGMRPNDRMGLIAFAARPYVVCPLTLDHEWLRANTERVDIGMIEDGTAVGSSILAALNRLRHSTAKTKLIILLTDGRNNAGKVSPLTAAQAAAALKVKIYTIGAGSTGPVPYPAQDVFGRTVYQNVEIDLDEDSLRQIAETTGGKYFRATDTESLKRVYAEIDKLEKTPFEQQLYHRMRELSPWFVLLGLLLLFAELVVRETALITSE